MNVRQLYLDFFQHRGHKVYDSMPLVPDDSSLLFTNAGMVQFKDIFTGKIPTPNNPKATSSQLCIRAGGKHNDLENVGYTARHHTLFEMLGNFSFGDYFKKEAISFAWEFVTKVLGFDKSLLYITIHESDDEAFDLWCEYVEKDRIKRMGDKDNFWQMGDTGPCGPCSEIYIDQGAKYFHSKEDYFGGEGDRFLEIWNLVFMQYEQKDGKRTPLPKPSIDTGMGLERVIAVLEHKINNFDTSLFAPLMQTIESLTHKAYIHDDVLLDNKMGFSDSQIQEARNIQASFRVIADHARSVAFLLAQGVNFDKEGRGYVLRRILRRGVRHGYLLGLRKSFLYKVVEAVCDSMGQHYDYLLERKEFIMEQCRNEEERFFETLELGMELFEKELQALLQQKKSPMLFSGDVAFKLYDTYGFPLDLTQDMLKSQDIQIDMASFETQMNIQKNRSKASWKGSGDMSKEGEFKTLISKFGYNKFVGYESLHAHSHIIALMNDAFELTETLQKGQNGYIYLDATPFYPESGGPIGDKGIIKKDNHIVATIEDTQKFFGLNLSRVHCVETLYVGDNVESFVDESRYEIAKHHSATHLLHLALRTILGSHITQAGSLVEPHRLRFDFSHPKPLSKAELEEIEHYVNRQIFAANPQVCETMDIQKAKEKGAMALFGEKYGQNVRVISFGDSIELCGGIHVANSGQIGNFYIIKESGVSSGVRRIEAVCGKAGYEYSKTALHTISQAKESLKTQDILHGIQKLKTQITESKASQATHIDIKKLESQIINDTMLIVTQISEGNIKDIIDKVKNTYKSVAILLLQDDNKGRITLAAGVKNVSLKAGEWIKEVAQILGGNGGGRDDFATAGGKDSTKIHKALTHAIQKAKDSIN